MSSQKLNGFKSILSFLLTESVNVDFFTLSKSMKVLTCQKFPVSNLTNIFRTRSSA